MNLNRLFLLFVFVFCVFILHTNGSQKVTAALTTATINPKKQPKRGSKWERKNPNSNLSFDINGSLKDSVDYIPEADVSGDDGENLLEDNPLQSERTAVNGTSDSKLSSNLQLEEMPDSDEELIIEKKGEVKLKGSHIQNASSSTKQKPVRECDRSLNEYRVLNLISSGALPYDAVFPAWNQLKTLTEKLNFLNQTLVHNKLQPLPKCDVRDLNLILSPMRLSFFMTYTMPITTPKTGKPIKMPDLSERMKMLQAINGYIEDGYLPPNTLTLLQAGAISKEWIKKNLTQNRDFILSKLSTPVQILINTGQMPSDIEEAILSGKYNKSEIQRMMLENDDVVKMMLPKKLSDMLEDRPVPDELKRILISGKNESEMRKAIMNDTELLQEMMSPSMFYFYSLFQIQRNRDISTALSILLIVILTCVMTSLGCTMTLEQIGQHAKKPKGVIIALFAQFVIMPAAAFGLTRAFNLEVFASMAVLICGCCPGGNLSNMLAYALSGDMNLSILMTTCSSIIGLGMMPLNIFIYSRFIVPVDSSQIIPFDKIVLNIALTIIPVAFGIAVRHRKPHWVPYIMRFGGCCLAAGTVSIAVLSGIMFGDAFFIYFPLPVLGCCAILPMAGYLFGYAFAWIVRERPKCRRTICMETGCQNVQLCSTVLKLAFDRVLVGVLFLMPLVYMCFQVVEAVLIILVFKLYHRCRGKKELVEEEDSEVKKKSDVESTDDDKKNSEQDDTKTLLDTKQETGLKEPEVNGKPKDKDTENNPTAGKPTEPYTDTFKAAGTEHLF